AVGSCAISTHEPCQVRKEAALSGITYVPRGSLTRAGDKSNAYVRQSKKGARYKITISNASIIYWWVRFLYEKGSLLPSFQKSLYILYAILNVCIFNWKGEGKG